MMPASIVLVAPLLALVTPAVAATNLKSNNTAVLEIDDETLTAKSFAAAAKSWGVDHPAQLSVAKSSTSLGQRTAKPLRIATRWR